MTIKKFLGVFLSVALAAPTSAMSVTTGTVRGLVSVTGRGVEGVSLSLVNVETGKTYAVKTTADGRFSAVLPSGSYVVLSPGRAGVTISRAPLAVEVVSGKVATANIEMAVASLQSPAAATGSAKITHDFVDCIPEGEFTLILALFEPLSSVVNGRLYFQSNLSPEWFYTEFEKLDTPSPEGFTHRAFIPKVTKDGGIETINYYLQVTSSDFAENKTPEHSAKVVSGESECEGKMGLIGKPDGAISVLSASGAQAGALAGFGGVAGATLGSLAIAGIVAGVVVGGAVVREATQSEPTPTPATPTPATPTPTTPTPSTPVPVCTLTVVAVPDAPADASVGGRFCTIALVSTTNGNLGNISGTRTFSLPCTSGVSAFANVAPQSSIAGPLPADWSNACTGSALGVPCVINPLGTNRVLGLTCSTR